MEIRIDKAGPVPIHDQIQEQIVGLIHSGKLKAGDQLPTMRALSIELSVNFNTVAHAYRELDNRGLIVTRRGEGTFVASQPGEPDLRHLREKKLHALVQHLVNEANRLGYNLDEVVEALQAHLPSTKAEDKDNA